MATGTGPPEPVPDLGARARNAGSLPVGKQIGPSVAKFPVQTSQFSMDAGLKRSLKVAGRPARTITLADGTQLMLLPYGGRVLGLFAPGDRENFFWVNPLLRRADTARAFFSSGRWQNLGGERTWLGPEYAFFFPDFPELGNYRPPAQLDATTFGLRRKGATCGLTALFRLRCLAPVATVKVRLTKWLAGATDPLRADWSRPALKNLRYAGYTTRSTLELVKTNSRALTVGLWSLAQLPHGGEMVIPVYGQVKPRVFFGHVPHGDLRTRDGLIRYRMRSRGEHKIGVPALSGTGRLGYLCRTADGTAQLVVRNYLANPSGVYRDAPSSHPGEGGYGAQACSVNNPELGRFSELEHHAPAVGSSNPHGQDEVQMWAYRGPRREIARAAEMLLGASPSMTF